MARRLLEAGYKAAKAAKAADENAGIALNCCLCTTALRRGAMKLAPP